MTSRLSFGEFTLVILTHDFLTPSTGLISNNMCGLPIGWPSEKEQLSLCQVKLLKSRTAPRNGKFAPESSHTLHIHIHDVPGFYVLLQLPS